MSVGLCGLHGSKVFACASRVRRGRAVVVGRGAAARRRALGLDDGPEVWQRCIDAARVGDTQLAPNCMTGL